MRRSFALAFVGVLCACGNQQADVENTIKARLKDPDSAKFQRVLVSEKGDQACAIWNAKNSFGGYGEWSATGLRKTPGGWQIPATNSKSKRLKSLPLNTSALWVIEQLDSEGKSPYLFPSPATGKPYTTITRAWYVIRRAAGIPDNVRIHDLRHTFASRLVSAGRSMVELQSLLGHADPRVSQRYAHLSSKSALAASNAAAFAVA